MNCIKYIRNNTDEFIKAMEIRKIDSSKVDELLRIDLELRETIGKLEFNQKEKNLLNKKAGSFDQSSQEYKELIDQGSKINDFIVINNSRTNDLKQKVDDLLANFPNILDESVPDGNSENDNLIIKTEGIPKVFDFPILDHLQLGENLDLIDLNAARKISGGRFSIFKNDLARMQRALINMLLDHNISHGYQEITHPVLISRNAVYNTGQLPKFEDDLFITKDDRILSPTSEVTLVNMHSDETIDIKKLPIRYTSYAECFRAEAGAAGRDTKGIIRQHQFAKVELVSLTSQDKSDDELERMIKIPEEILGKLKIPYRRVLLCSGDTGFSANKTYDIEIWLPSQSKYREVSSCSKCDAFQARRLKTKYKDIKTKKTEFIHTLNGSSLAIGRLIVAILENHQMLDGTIAIPNELQKYMNGQELLKNK